MLRTRAAGLQAEIDATRTVLQARDDQSLTDCAIETVKAFMQEIHLLEAQLVCPKCGARLTSLWFCGQCGVRYELTPLENEAMIQPITDNELRIIEALANAATPEPWVIHPDPRYYVLMPESSEEEVQRDRNVNAAFCAGARSAVPRLVAEVRRQRAALDQVDTSTQLIEAGLARIAAQNTELEEGHRQLREENDRLYIERNELAAELYLFRAKANVSICAWCGQEFPKGPAAIAEHVLTCEKRPEKKLAEEIARLSKGLDHLDAILAAYEADDRGALVVACQLATQWRQPQEP